MQNYNNRLALKYSATLFFIRFQRFNYFIGWIHFPLLDDGTPNIFIFVSVNVMRCDLQNTRLVWFNSNEQKLKQALYFITSYQEECLVEVISSILKLKEDLFETLVLYFSVWFVNMIQCIAVVISHTIDSFLLFNKNDSLCKCV